MRAILPGKPQARLQALCTTEWEGLRLVVQAFIHPFMYIHR